MVTCLSKAWERGNNKGRRWSPSCYLPPRANGDDDDDDGDPRTISLRRRRTSLTAKERQRDNGDGREKIKEWKGFSFFFDYHDFELRGEQPRKTGCANDTAKTFSPPFFFKKQKMREKWTFLSQPPWVRSIAMFASRKLRTCQSTRWRRSCTCDRSKGFHSPRMRSDSLLHSVIHSIEKGRVLFVYHVSTIPRAAFEGARERAHSKFLSRHTFYYERDRSFSAIF